MQKNEETENDPLIHCEYTSDLWHLVLNLFGVSWALAVIYVPNFPSMNLVNLVNFKNF
jgi:hypothetical protein